MKSRCGMSLRPLGLHLPHLLADLLLIRHFTPLRLGDRLLQLRIELLKRLAIPPLRTLITREAFAFTSMRRLLPDGLFESAVRFGFGMDHARKT